MHSRIKSAAFSVAMLFILSSPVIFASCSRGKGPAHESRVKILSSFYPLHVMLLNITDGIDGVSLSTLDESGCIHGRELKPGELESIISCDIFVANGLGMESYMDRVIEVKGDAVIDASEGYDCIDGNPHVWLSVDGAMYQVLEITAGLSRLDPERSEEYMKNASSYINRLLKLSVKMQSELESYAERKVVSFHEAFSYLFRELNLVESAYVRAESGIRPSDAEMDALVALISGLRKKGQVPVLFYGPQYTVASDIVSEETGLKLWELDACVSGPMKKDSYVKSMERNLKVLKSALKD